METNEYQKYAEVNAKSFGRGSKTTRMPISRGSDRFQFVFRALPCSRTTRAQIRRGGGELTLMRKQILSIIAKLKVMGG